MNNENLARGFLAVMIAFIFFFGFFPELKGQPPELHQKITLDFKGVDIIDVLKIISQRTGMNVVASKNVIGKVTIFLKDVDAWDAFEIILLSNDLAYDLKGDIVTVMTGREYESLYGERFKDKKELAIIKLNYAKVSDVARALTQVKTNLGRVVVDEGSNTLILMESHERLEQMRDALKAMDASTETRVFSLDYAKSDKLIVQIQDMITKGLGSVKFDERTNKVVVTDVPEKIAEIEKVITAFDEKTRQVLIDAKIVQVELDDKFQAGIDWKAVFRRLTVEQALSAGLTSGGKLTIATVLGKPENTLNVVIDFLRNVGKTDIISSPRITALDGQEAKILVGTKEAYITATTTTPAAGAVTTAESVNFVDVGIQLYVTPVINKEGYVTMKIRPVVSSVSSRIKTTASPDGVPIVKTSEAETSIVAKDGVTIVMGGLMEENKIKSVEKIPFLGDIPVLGFPFRRTLDELKKTELVIFLTPTIISGDSIEAVPDMKTSPVYSQYYNALRDKELATDLYYQDVRGKILNMAATLISGEILSGEAVVSFSISRDGSIYGEPKLLSVVRPELAEAALRCVKDSAPFSSFPADLKKDKENFKISISFE
ncbi:MAG: secretin N-terminal domain-containing protein [Candidatus Omnitrophota bacterium]